MKDADEDPPDVIPRGHEGQPLTSTQVDEGAARFERLLADAIARYDLLSPDEKLHMRHAQRVSFAFGNVALSYPSQVAEYIMAAVQKAAGPCPCEACKLGILPRRGKA